MVLYQIYQITRFGINTAHLDESILIYLAFYPNLFETLIDQVRKHVIGIFSNSWRLLN